MVYYIGSIPCFSSYIQHWGIKGQKWGVRRFRNPDGTLTDAGKARYRINPDGSITKKTSRNMTDSELKASINRLVAEKQFDGLIKDLDKSKSKKSGQSAVKKILGFTGNKILAPILTATATSIAKAWVAAWADDMKKSNENKNSESDDMKKSNKNENSESDNSNGGKPLGLPPSKKKKQK